jgi:hypothetical protein
MFIWSKYIQYQEWNHPFLEDFLNAKSPANGINYFFISLTDKFKPLLPSTSPIQEPELQLLQMKKSIDLYLLLILVRQRDLITFPINSKI